jgi:RNA polymerase sigma-70 factor (ECF subfamily)
MEPPDRPPGADGSDFPSTAPPAPSGAEATAFAKHVLPEVDVLYRVALSVTGNHADAQDLVQDTLLRAYRAIGRFDGRHPRAWLLTILRNANRNRARRRSPELLADPEAALSQVASNAPAGGDVGAAVAEITFDAVIERALGELSDKLRSVVELVDIDGLTYEEAAEVLEVPVGTVMSRLHRARRRLRSRLIAAGLTPRKPS